MRRLYALHCTRAEPVRQAVGGRRNRYCAETAGLSSGPVCRAVSAPALRRCARPRSGAQRAIGLLRASHPFIRQFLITEIHGAAAVGVPIARIEREISVGDGGHREPEARPIALLFLALLVCCDSAAVAGGAIIGNPWALAQDLAVVRAGAYQDCRGAGAPSELARARACPPRPV